MKRLIVLLTVVCLFGIANPGWAEDALLKTLQNKGVITEEEASIILAEQDEYLLPRALKGLSIGGLAFIDYSAGTKYHTGRDFNQFSLTRGYIDIKKNIRPWFRVRVTPDIAQTSGSDIELIMKYYYADFLLEDYWILTDNNLRVGQAHMPYLDFQHGINIYRMQGKMFQDRFRNFNSADMGISVLGNFGEKLTREQQQEVGYPTSYSGRYGSYHVGLFNGGGYHATEENQNKVIEWRASLRPLPDMIPGLQLTYFGLSGKGNTDGSPRWNNDTAFISYQNRNLVLTGEYVEARGEQNGADENKKKGYSVFGDFKLAMYDRLALMVRYDVWDPDTDTDDDEETLFIGGISTRINGNNYILLAFEQSHRDSTECDDKKGQVVFQISF